MQRSRTTEEQKSETEKIIKKQALRFEVFCPSTQQPPGIITCLVLAYAEPSVPALMGGGQPQKLSAQFSAMLCWVSSPQPVQPSPAAACTCQRIESASTQLGQHDRNTVVGLSEKMIPVTLDLAGHQDAHIAYIPGPDDPNKMSCLKKKIRASSN
jgi:hypothetical protein